MTEKKEMTPEERRRFFMQKRAEELTAELNAEGIRIENDNGHLALVPTKRRLRPRENGEFAWTITDPASPAEIRTWFLVVKGYEEFLLPKESEVVMTKEEIAGLKNEQPMEEGFITEDEPKNIALSWSRIQDMRCPYRFNAKHIEKTFIEPPSDIMVIGSEVHEVIAAYRQHCFKIGRETDIGFFSDLEKNIQPYRSRDSLKRETLLTYPERSVKLIEKFTEGDIRVPVFDALTPMIEKQLVFDWNLNPVTRQKAWFGGKDVAFRAIADFAYVSNSTGTLFIIDDKTGWKEADSEQLRWYSYLVPKWCEATETKWKNNKRPYETITCILNYVAKGRTEVVGRFEDKEVADVRDIILRHLDTVNGWKEFPAVESELCKNCLIQDCSVRKKNSTMLMTLPDNPIGQQEMPKSIETIDEMHRMIGFYEFLSDVKKRAEALMREFVQEHGKVEYMGRVVEERPYTPWKPKDTQSVLKALISIGVDKNGILKELGLNEKSVIRLLKKAGQEDKLPMVLSMGERKQYKPKFGLYSLKEDEETIDI